MNNIVVQIVKAGNRYNAWDADGNKWTSKIGTTTRKGAYEADMALEQRVGKTGKNYWWKVPMDNFEDTTVQLIDTNGNLHSGHVLKVSCGL